jgi:hypothetical protein
VCVCVSVSVCESACVRESVCVRKRERGGWCTCTCTCGVRVVCSRESGEHQYSTAYSIHHTPMQYTIHHTCGAVLYSGDGRGVSLEDIH